MQPHSTQPVLKAILFDLDDTLIDWGDFFDDWETLETRNLHGVYRYLREQGHMLGGLTPFMQEYTRRARDAWGSARLTLEAPHVGRVLVATAEACGVPPGTLDEDACLKAYDWDGHLHAKVFPDVPPALRLLQQTPLRLGIVTNAFQPMWMRDLELARYGLRDFFPTCRFSAADVGYLKPHPRIFNAALECLDVPPESVVFIGDNPTADIGGAKQVGMKAILRVRANVRRFIPQGVKPDARLDTLAALPGILDRWFPGWRSG